MDDFAPHFMGCFHIGGDSRFFNSTGDEQRGNGAAGNLFSCDADAHREAIFAGREGWKAGAHRRGTSVAARNVTYSSRCTDPWLRGSWGECGWLGAGTQLNWDWG